MMLDLRHLDADVLAAMLRESLDACRSGRGGVRLRGRAAARLRRRRRRRSTRGWSSSRGAAVARGGRRRRAADPVRPAARRDRDRAPRPDRDDLRPVRPAALAHRDRGLARGRRCGSRSRPTGARSARRSTRVAAGERRAGGGMSLDFGVVLQTDPPASRVIDLAKRAESYGFTHAWTFDSHLLWEEPFVIYSRILNETHRADRRPDGHQPGDPRLDGHRLAVRDAQRDVRQPHRLRHRPRRLGGARHQRQAGARSPSCARRSASSAGWPTARRSTTRARRCGCRGARDSRLEIWVAAYGPKALALAGEVGDGFILQLADPDITAWSIAAVRRAAEAAGRDPDASRSASPRPAYVTDGTTRARPRARPVPLVRRHGRQPRRRHRRPLRRRRRRGADGADRLHRRARGLRLQRARARGQHPHRVRARRDRRPLLPASARPRTHVARLHELAGLGVDQFALYLQHDAKDATLAAYGEHVIPAMATRPGVSRASRSPTLSARARPGRAG